MQHKSLDVLGDWWLLLYAYELLSDHTSDRRRRPEGRGAMQIRVKRHLAVL